MNTKVQPMIPGGRVLLGTRVALSTRLAMGEVARRNKRSVSAEVNAAVQAHLERHAVR